MTFFQAVILGIVQGLTEFLPISSSGHLVIFQHLLNIGEPPIIFDAAVHLATLGAVLIYFRQQIWAAKLKDWLIIAVGTVPAMGFGLFVKSYLDNLFSSLSLISATLFVTGLLMFYAHYLARRNTKPLKKITLLRGFWIGVWQAAAILPGISRSGATVAGALANDINREAAFSFSFLLSIPAILGASLLLIFDELGSLDQVFSLNVLTGMMAAFIFALLSLAWFHRVISNSKLWLFGVYCIGLSILVFFIFL